MLAAPTAVPGGLNTGRLLLLVLRAGCLTAAVAVGGSGLVWASTLESVGAGSVFAASGLTPLCCTEALLKLRLLPLFRADGGTTDGVGVGL